jgi:antitoxin component of MazEF toxin-antitoxin module
MIEFKSKLKRWGRSFGIVVPMEKLRKANINENTAIEITITKQENPLKKHFGTVKFKKPIEEILDEGDRDSWGE